MITLAISSRTASGSTGAAGVRAEGRVPAVIYGAHHEATPISVSLAEIEAVLRHGGETSILELVGLEKPIQALIHDLERNPVTNAPYHVDFYVVEKGSKVTMNLPLAYVGESEAVRLGAHMVKVMHEIEIEAAADKLPHEIEVDISALTAIGDQIRVSDIKAPAGVTFLTDGEEVVALAQEPAGEEVDSPVLDMDAIEVEKKGKADVAEDAE